MITHGKEPFVGDSRPETLDDDIAEPQYVAPTDKESEISLVKGEISTLVADVRNLAKTEIEYLKLRAAYSGNIAKKVGIFGGLAAVLGFCAIIALILGLLLTLASLMPPIAATAIVTGTFLAIAVVLAILAASKAKKLSFESETTDE